tara:strand:+ start:24162 stop:25289 length:1128 start_codon:yes stop_codon:yes gene_type:complete
MLFSCKKENVINSNSTICSFQKNIGGSSDDLSNSIVIKGDFIYVLGHSNSFGDVNGDHYLIKLDLEGNIIFEKTYGGNLAEEGVRIIETSDGNFILLGITESYGSGNKDIHVIKIDCNGVVIWEKYFGGLADDTPSDIIETKNSEFCISATTESFGAGARDIYLMWIDQSGNLVRERTFGGIENDGSSNLIEIENNQIMLYGYTRNFGANSRDLYLMKVSSIGDSLRAKRYGGSGYEESQGFVRTSKGGFLINGHSSSTDPNHNMYALEIDSNGNIIWENNYGGALHDGGQAVLINNEGNYVLLGRSMSFGNGNSDMYLVVTNPNGELISEEIIGGYKNDIGLDIIEYKSFYFIIGYSDSFGSGDNDAYIVKLKK